MKSGEKMGVYIKSGEKMGVYIPGMEMPETCFECPFMYARRYCCADLTLDLWQGDYAELKGRVDGCPLVPVPQHGHWVHHSDYLFGFQDRCSVCNFGVDERWVDDFHYCPNCGAKMESDEP